MKQVVQFIPVLVLVGLILLSPRAAAGSSFKVLHNFGTGQDGKSPWGALTLDGNGNLYGTAGGGVNEVGTVFEISPLPGGAWTETTIYSFTHSQGDDPAAAVAFDNLGNLYGTTTDGGTTNQGIIFQLVPAGEQWSLNTIYDYGLRTGVLPDNAGGVYATTGPGENGGGAVAHFVPDPAGWTFTDIYSFCALPKCRDGMAPGVPPIWDRYGNLYGTALYGGNYSPNCLADNYGCGVVYKLIANPDGTWTYRLLHEFASSASDGQSPSGSVVVDQNNNVYGTTWYGGPNLGGTVYRLSPSTVGRNWRETLLYTFADCAQGCQPYAGLTADQKGALYGIAGGGNPICDGFDCGLVFRLTQQRDGIWKYAVIHKFSGPDGMFPNAVTVGPNGNIYGTTQAGGKYNFGVAFEITP